MPACSRQLIHNSKAQGSKPSQAKPSQATVDGRVEYRQIIDT